MTSDTFSFFDPGALVIVLAGTLIATTARCGWRDMGVALKALTGLFRSSFDQNANRAQLARAVTAFRAHGHLCADIEALPDPSLERLVKAYQVSGSIEGLHSAARAERSAREIERARAVRVLDYAGDLAPVFGLVGTLFSISQLGSGEGLSAAEATMGAVATAVLSSLYGVLTAHLLCNPLAGAIERRGILEEEARSELSDWLEAELTGEKPSKLVGLKDAA